MKDGSQTVSVSEKENFIQSIDQTNRWVILAEKIHWEKLEYYFQKKVQPALHPGVSTRTLIASYFVKYKLKLTSDESVRMINESPFLQYFAEAGKFYGSPPLNAPLMRSMRNRFAVKEWSRFKKIITQDSIATPFGRFMLSFRKSIRLPEKETKHKKHHSHKVEAKVKPDSESELFTSLGLEYKGNGSSSHHKTKSSKGSGRINRKAKQVLNFLLWFVLISLVVGSLLLIVFESDWPQGIFKSDKLKTK